MIVIKTELKEIPNDCAHCPMLHKEKLHSTNIRKMTYSKFDIASCCGATPKLVILPFDISSGRPKFCPLMAIGDE